MIKKLAFLLALLGGTAFAQSTFLLPSGGIGLSCNAITAASSANPGTSSAGCASLALVTSGNLLPGNYTWQVSTTGTPASIVVNFMGSLDGVVWVQLDTTTAAGFKTISNQAYKYLGCIPATLSGGSSPTISCQVSVSSGSSGAGGGTVTGVTASTPVSSTGGNAPVISLDSTGTGSMTAYATDTGSANAVVIAVPSWYPASATLGSCVNFKAAASATGATTINITPSGGSAYGAIALDKRTTAGVSVFGASGDVVTGGIYKACYDGTEWVIEATSSEVYTGGALSATGIITGNSNNQVQGTSRDLITAATGAVSKWFNLTTAGATGLVPTYGVISLTAQTAAISTATLCAAANCATTGLYNIDVYLDSQVSCGTPGPAVVGVTLTWTDETGTKSAQSVPVDVNGATSLTATLPLGTTTGFAAGHATIWTTGTIIQYATTYTACTSGTGTYGIRIAVTEVQ